MQCRVLIARFPGQHTEHPASSDWAWRTYEKAKADPRVSEVLMWRKSDTPITMVRNLCVKEALAKEVDVLLMVDSDMRPDCEEDGQPFWDTTFEFWWNRRHAPMVIGAPYTGPPPINNIYVFHYENRNNYDPNHFHLPQYTRHQAATMAGISKCGALPTGVIFYGNLSQCMKLRATDPGPGLPPSEEKGWFYYEWKDETASEKASTEDVTNTRDIGILLAQSRIPGAGLYCNWGAWAAHIKPQEQRKPTLMTPEDVGASLRNAWESQARRDERTFELAVDLPPATGSPIPPFPPIHEQKPDDRAAILASYGMAKPIDREALETAAVECRDSFTASDAREVVYAVEVGSWTGLSAMAIWRGLGPDAFLFCVDTWEGSETDTTSKIVRVVGRETVMDAFKKNTAYAGRKIQQCVGESVEMAHGWLDDSVHFLHIDADHSYDSVVQDTDAWLPKVKDGGTICYHDYRTENFEDVTQAVHDLFGVGNVEHLHVDGEPTQEARVILTPEVRAEYQRRKAERTEAVNA